MESDGRIRSKDIGTGEVNSRALDNIRSSNFNGSHVDPENDPGTLGWQILKSGVVVFNNAIIRGTLKAVKILAGTLNIGTGGTITLGDESAPTATLSETGIEVGPTELTASGVTVGPTTLNASGVTVGTDVVMDSTGLLIEGILQPAFWPFTASGSAADVSLTTTATDFVTLTIEPPDWVQQLHLISFLRVQMSASATHNVRAGLTNDDGGASSQRANGSQTVPNGQTGGLTIPNRETIPLSPAGRNVDIVADASVNSGTNSSNLINLSVLGFGTRV